MAFPYKRIMCPIDFDDNSMKALDKAVELARYFDALIALVHVIPLVTEYSGVPIPYDLYAEQEKAGRAKLAEIVAQKLIGIQQESATYVGDVIGSILRAADRFKPDLLVMATHGRSGLAHLFLGSIAEAVVRKASCPVLTIH